MRQIQSPPRISTLKEKAHVSILSKIANMRCVHCKAVQPYSRLSRTNPYNYMWNKYDAHKCSSCSALLYLTGKGRHKRVFLFVLPMFLLVGFGGGKIMTALPGLHYYHEARQGLEPNVLGFLLLCSTICVMALCLQRFEEIQVFKEPNKPHRTP